MQSWWRFAPIPLKDLTMGVWTAVAKLQHERGFLAMCSAALLKATKLCLQPHCKKKTVNNTLVWNQGNHRSASQPFYISTHSSPSRFVFKQGDMEKQENPCSYISPASIYQLLANLHRTRVTNSLEVFSLPTYTKKNTAETEKWEWAKQELWWPCRDALSVEATLRSAAIDSYMAQPSKRCWTATDEVLTSSKDLLMYCNPKENSICT